MPPGETRPLARSDANRQAPDGGIAVPALAAFIADHAHGFDASAALPRGRRLTLPLLESVADVPFDLDLHVANRDAILIFYAGGWNRPDNEALGTLQGAMPAFERLGAAVVAISPELPLHASATAERNRVSYALAIDHACRFAKGLGVVVKLPTELRRAVRDAGIRLKQWNGEGSYDLPMPVVILLDRERRVRWTACAPATSDLAVEDVIAALCNLVTVEGDSLPTRGGGNPFPSNRPARHEYP